MDVEQIRAILRYLDTEESDERKVDFMRAFFEEKSEEGSYEPNDERDYARQRA